jgi:hypothetical protein
MGKQMNARISQAAVLTLMVLVVSSASAQPPAVAIKAMQESKIPLLIRNDVAKALELTEGQKEKIKKELSSISGRRPPNMGMLGGLMGDMIRGKIREMEGKMLSVLDKGQRSRFDQIQIQWLGPLALYRKDIQKGLSLNRDQMKLIGQIKKRAESARKGSKTGPSLERPGTDSERKELLASLTPTQIGDLARLGGAPISFGSPSGTYAQVPEPQG